MWRRVLRRSGVILGSSLVVVVLGMSVPVRVAAAASIDDVSSSIAMLRVEVANVRVDTTKLRSDVDWLRSTLGDTHNRVTAAWDSANKARDSSARADAALSRIEPTVSWLQTVTGETHSRAEAARAEAQRATVAAQAALAGVAAVKADVAAARADILSAVSSAVGAGGVPPALAELLQSVLGSMGAEPCQRPLGGDWWTELTADDDGCMQRRGDIRDMTRKLEEAQRKGAEEVARRVSEAVKVAKDVAEAAAKGAEAQRKKAEDIAERAAKAAEETAKNTRKDGDGPAWDAGTGRPMPRLGQWGSMATCLKIEPASGSLCGYGPVIKIASWEWRPLSFCGDLSGATRWRDFIGSVMVVMTAWKCFRYMSASIGLVLGK